MEVFEFSCPLCGKSHYVEARLEDYSLFKKGVSAQYAFPTPRYTAEQREQFISNICLDCQKKIFG